MKNNRAARMSKRVPNERRTDMKIEFVTAVYDRDRRNYVAGKRIAEVQMPEVPEKRDQVKLHGVLYSVVNRCWLPMATSLDAKVLLTKWVEMA